MHLAESPLIEVYLGAIPKTIVLGLACLNQDKSAKKHQATLAKLAFHSCFKIKKKKTPLKIYIVRFWGSIHPSYIKSPNKIWGKFGQVFAPSIVQSNVFLFFFDTCHSDIPLPFLVWGWLEMPMPILETAKLRLNLVSETTCWKVVNLNNGYGWLSKSSSSNRGANDTE